MKNKVWKYILWIVLIVWILFSIYYVGRDMMARYQTSVMQNSYQKGYTDSIDSLITEAKKCEPVTAYNQEDSVELIWTECLNGEDNTSAEEQPNN